MAVDSGSKSPRSRSSLHLVAVNSDESVSVEDATTSAAAVVSPSKAEDDDDGPIHHTGITHMIGALLTSKSPKKSSVSIQVPDTSPSPPQDGDDPSAPPQDTRRSVGSKKVTFNETLNDLPGPDDMTRSKTDGAVETVRLATGSTSRSRPSLGSRTRGQSLESSDPRLSLGRGQSLRGHRRSHFKQRESALRDSLFNGFV